MATETNRNAGVQGETVWHKSVWNDVTRNIDMAALRSFVAIAEFGGVTRAAEHMNLTQSAVSMQVKRLETALDRPLLARIGRGVRLTSEGEQLLSYGRQILRLNDEAWQRLTNTAFEGQIAIGIPEDLVQPHLPIILREFSNAFPRVSIRLVSSVTNQLKKTIQNGRLDLILTTESLQDSSGEYLRQTPFRWFVAEGSDVFTKRPLPIIYERQCIFLPFVARALDEAGIPWEIPYEADDWRDLCAFLSAGLGVQANVAYLCETDWVEVPAAAGLPALPDFGIFMYLRDNAPEAVLQLAGFIRDEYASAPLLCRGN